MAESSLRPLTIILKMRASTVLIVLIASIRNLPCFSGGGGGGGGGGREVGGGGGGDLG